MIEIDKKVSRSIGRLLNKQIHSFLYGGSGEAGYSELEGAATCFKTLTLLGLKVSGAKLVEEELRRENVFNTDFLK